MPSEDLHSSWSFYEDISSTFDQVEHYGINVDAHVDDYEFSSLFSTPEDSTPEVSPINFPSTIFSFNDHFQFPLNEDTLQLQSLMEDFPTDLDAFDPILSAQFVGIHEYPEESEGSFPSQNLSSEGKHACTPSQSMKSELSTVQAPLALPQEDMDIDNHLSLPHLLEATGEALEEGHKTLADVILGCISQKVTPLGEPQERLAFKLSQDDTTHGDHLKQEAGKIFEPAFRALYQGLPHGKVAHFAANSAILEAMPEESEVIHIVDFDLKEGIQWPSLMEAIAHLHKTLKLTSIKWAEESSECNSPRWKFEEIRRQLHEYARSIGLRLEVEEMRIQELVTELKEMNKRGGKRGFLAFNCMVGLPHMGRVRNKIDVKEFLRVAKDLINSSCNRGIIAFGDGDCSEKLRDCLNFRSFFDRHLVHYRALLESIEASFPSRSSEARAAMECLFVGPNVSYLTWLQKWEEMKEGCHLKTGIGLEGCRLSRGILMEVREMVRLFRETGDSYQARIEGQNGDELVLEWNGTQMLRVSTWRN